MPSRVMKADADDCQLATRPTLARLYPSSLRMFPDIPFGTVEPCKLAVPPGAELRGMCQPPIAQLDESACQSSIQCDGMDYVGELRANMFGKVCFPANNRHISKWPVYLLRMSCKLVSRWTTPAETVMLAAIHPLVPQTP